VKIRLLNTSSNEQKLHKGTDLEQAEQSCWKTLQVTSIQESSPATVEDLIRQMINSLPEHLTDREIV